MLDVGCWILDCQVMFFLSAAGKVGSRKIAKIRLAWELSWYWYSTVRYICGILPTNPVGIGIWCHGPSYSDKLAEEVRTDKKEWCCRLPTVK